MQRIPEVNVRITGCGQLRLHDTGQDWGASREVINYELLTNNTS